MLSSLLLIRTESRDNRTSVIRSTKTGFNLPTSTAMGNYFLFKLDYVLYIYSTPIR